MYDLLKKNIERDISISSDEWEIILSKIDHLKIKKNSYFQIQGSSAIKDGFVLKGGLKGYIINDCGEENILFFAFEGDWISDIESIYYKRKATYNIKAIENSELAIINKINKRFILKNIPQMKDFYIALLKKSNILMQKRLVDLLNKTSIMRYVEFMEKNPDLITRINNKNLSSYLGISKEFLSKIKNR